MPATVNAADRPESVLIQEPLVIPEEFGTIQEQNLSPDKTKPFIVLIQDAHAMADAQASIQKILRYLQEKYHISLVALEGGAGKVDAELFRAFPDAKLETKVMGEYVRRGELSGAQMASIFNPAKADYIGLENWKLYEANYLAFLRAGRNQESILKNLKTLTQELDEKRKNVYTLDLNKFHEAAEKFRGGEGDLFGLLNYLNSIGLSEDRKAGYPHLKILLDSMEREQALNTEELRSALQHLAEKFKKEAEAELGKPAAMELNEKMQAFSTASMDPAAFLKFLSTAVERAGYDLHLDPAMKELLKQTDMLAGIKGTKLFDELEGMLAEIQDRLAVRPEQKGMARKYSAIRILKDMAALEMTRDELREYEKDPAYYDGLVQDSKLLDPGLEFYRLALERDRILYDNLNSLMSRKKAASAAVIVGGFHRRGFEARLKQQNYSYAVIAPKMLSLSDSSVYQNVMLGKLSYKDYLKTTFYDAFARHAGMRLISEMNEPEFRNSLKQWRDQIIRNLSEQGRVAEAGQYTQYVDFLLQVYMEKYGTKNLTSKSKEEIIQTIEKELQGVKKSALARIAGRTQPSNLAASLGALSLDTPSDLLRELALNPGAFDAGALQERLEAALAAAGFSKLTRSQLEAALEKEAGGSAGLTPEISGLIQEEIGKGVAALNVLEKATEKLPESAGPVTPGARLAARSIVDAVHEKIPADTRENIVKEEIARELLTAYQKGQPSLPARIDLHRAASLPPPALPPGTATGGSLGVEKIGGRSDKVEPIVPAAKSGDAPEAPKDQPQQEKPSPPKTESRDTARDTVEISEVGRLMAAIAEARDSAERSADIIRRAPESVLRWFLVRAAERDAAGQAPALRVYATSYTPDNNAIEAFRSQLLDLASNPSGLYEFLQSLTASEAATGREAGEGNSLGTAEKQAALETIEVVTAALKKNYDYYQSVPDYRDPFMRKGLAEDVEYIVVGDLHGKPDHLWGILAVNDNYGKIMRGEAVLVLLGDVVHPEKGTVEELSDMASSVVIHRMVMELMRRAIDEDGYLRKVVYIPGNHEHLQPAVAKEDTSKKGIVSQGMLFAKELGKSFGYEYLDRYHDGFMANSPLLLITDGLLAAHAGPISAALKLAHIRQARVTDLYDKTDMASLIVHEAHWRRWSDDPDASFSSYYGADQVDYFLQMPGIEQPNAVLLVGHIPQEIPHGEFHHKLTDHLHVVYAARQEFGYVAFKKGALNFKKAVVMPDAPSDWNLDRLIKTPEDQMIYQWALGYFRSQKFLQAEGDYSEELTTRREIFPRALVLLSQFPTLDQLQKAREPVLEDERTRLESGATLDLYAVAQFDLAIELLKFRQQAEKLHVLSIGQFDPGIFSGTITQIYTGEESLKELTKLMLEAMRRLAPFFEGRTVADIGTGNGIHGIAAVRDLKAASAALSDISPEEIAKARSSVTRLNLSDKIQDIADASFFTGFLRKTFDIVLFNPPAQREMNVFLQVLPQYLSPEGFALLIRPLSGPDAESTRAAVPQGFELIPLIELRRAGEPLNWAVYAVARKDSMILSALDSLLKRSGEGASLGEVRVQSNKGYEVVKDSRAAIQKISGSLPKRSPWRIAGQSLLNDPDALRKAHRAASASSASEGFKDMAEYFRFLIFYASFDKRFPGLNSKFKIQNAETMAGLIRDESRLWDLLQNELSLIDQGIVNDLKVIMSWNTLLLEVQNLPTVNNAEIGRVLDSKTRPLLERINDAKKINAVKDFLLDHASDVNSELWGVYLDYAAASQYLKNPVKLGDVKKILLAMDRSDLTPERAVAWFPSPLSAGQGWQREDFYGHATPFFNLPGILADGEVVSEAEALRRGYTVFSGDLKAPIDSLDSKKKHPRYFANLNDVTADEEVYLLWGHIEEDYSITPEDESLTATAFLIPKRTVESSPGLNFTPGLSQWDFEETLTEEYTSSEAIPITDAIILMHAGQYRRVKEAFRKRIIPIPNSWTLDEGVEFLTQTSLGKISLEALLGNTPQKSKPRANAASLGIGKQVLKGLNLAIPPAVSVALLGNLHLPLAATVGVTSLFWMDSLILLKNWNTRQDRKWNPPAAGWFMLGWSAILYAILMFLPPSWPFYIYGVLSIYGAVFLADGIFGYRLTREAFKMASEDRLSRLRVRNEKFRHQGIKNSALLAMSVSAGVVAWNFGEQLTRMESVRQSQAAKIRWQAGRQKHETLMQKREREIAALWQQLDDSFTQRTLSLILFGKNFREFVNEFTPEEKDAILKVHFVKNGRGSIPRKQMERDAAFRPLYLKQLIPALARLDQAGVRRLLSQRVRGKVGEFNQAINSRRDEDGRLYDQFTVPDLDAGILDEVESRWNIPFPFFLSVMMRESGGNNLKIDQVYPGDGHGLKQVNRLTLINYWDKVLEHNMIDWGWYGGINVDDGRQNAYEWIKANIKEGDVVTVQKKPIRVDTSDIQIFRKLTLGDPLDEAHLIESRLIDTLSPEQRKAIMTRRLKILFFTENGPEKKKRSPVARPLLFNPTINLRVGSLVLSDSMRVMDDHLRKLTKDRAGVSEEPITQLELNKFAAFVYNRGESKAKKATTAAAKERRLNPANFGSVLPFIAPYYTPADQITYSNYVGYITGGPLRNTKTGEINDKTAGMSAFFERLFRDGPIGVPESPRAQSLGQDMTANQQKLSELRNQALEFKDQGDLLNAFRLYREARDFASERAMSPHVIEELQKKVDEVDGFLAPLKRLPSAGALPEEIVPYLKYFISFTEDDSLNAYRNYEITAVIPGEGLQLILSRNKETNQYVMLTFTARGELGYQMAAGANFSVVEENATLVAFEPTWTVTFAKKQGLMRRSMPLLLHHAILGDRLLDEWRSVPGDDMRSDEANDMYRWLERNAKGLGLALRYDRKNEMYVVTRKEERGWNLWSWIKLGGASLGTADKISGQSLSPSAGLSTAPEGGSSPGTASAESLGAETISTNLVRLSKYLASRRERGVDVEIGFDPEGAMSAIGASAKEWNYVTLRLEKDGTFTLPGGLAIPALLRATFVTYNRGVRMERSIREGDPELVKERRMVRLGPRAGQNREVRLATVFAGTAQMKIGDSTITIKITPHGVLVSSEDPLGREGKSFFEMGQMIGVGSGNLALHRVRDGRIGPIHVEFMVINNTLMVRNNEPASEVTVEFEEARKQSELPLADLIPEIAAGQVSASSPILTREQSVTRIRELETEREDLARTKTSLKTLFSGRHTEIIQGATRLISLGDVHGDFEAMLAHILAGLKAGQEDREFILNILAKNLKRLDPKDGVRRRQIYQEILAMLPLEAGDVIALAGDLTDRGDQNVEVLEFIMGLQKYVGERAPDSRVLVVMGDHDYALWKLFLELERRRTEVGVAKAQDIASRIATGLRFSGGKGGSVEAFQRTVRELYDAYGSYEAMKDAGIVDFVSRMKQMAVVDRSVIAHGDILKVKSINSMNEMEAAYEELLEPAITLVTDRKVDLLWDTIWHYVHQWSALPAKENRGSFYDLIERATGLMPNRLLVGHDSSEHKVGRLKAPSDDVFYLDGGLNASSRAQGSEPGILVLNARALEPGESMSFYQPYSRSMPVQSVYRGEKLEDIFATENAPRAHRIAAIDKELRLLRESLEGRPAAAPQITSQEGEIPRRRIKDIGIDLQITYDIAEQTQAKVLNSGENFNLRVADVVYIGGFYAQVLSIGPEGMEFLVSRSRDDTEWRFLSVPASRLRESQPFPLQLAGAAPATAQLYFDPAGNLMIKPIDTESKIGIHRALDRMFDIVTQAGAAQASTGAAEGTRVEQLLVDPKRLSEDVLSFLITNDVVQIGQTYFQILSISSEGILLMEAAGRSDLHPKLHFYPMSLLKEPGKRISLGRSPDSRIQIKGPGVSHHHAEFSLKQHEDEAVSLLLHHLSVSFPTIIYRASSLGISTQARRDLDGRSDKFLAQQRLKESDEIIRDLISGKFKVDLETAFGPWIESGMITGDELDDLIGRVQGFVFGEAMRTANAALSVLQKYYDDRKIEFYQGVTARAVAKIAANPQGKKLPLATNFNREGMPIVREAMAPFAGRIKELKIYYDENIPTRQDIAAWSGLKFNVMFKHMDSAKLSSGDLESFYVLTQSLELPPKVARNLHSIMAQILELQDERVRKLAFSSAILLTFLLADYADRLKPENFRNFLEAQKDKLGEDMGFLGQWFEMGQDGMISLRLSEFVFSLVNDETAAEAVKRAA